MGETDSRPGGGLGLFRAAGEAEEQSLLPPVPLTTTRKHPSPQSQVPLSALPQTGCVPSVSHEKQGISRNPLEGRCGRNFLKREQKDNMQS